MDVMRLTSVQQVARVGKRTAECGQNHVEGQQVNIKPRLVYHRECPLKCIQSKEQLVT